MQRSSSVRTVSDDRQGATSDELCSACGQRYEEVWSRFVPAPAHRATLAWRARETHVQARHHDVQRSARTSSPVPDGCFSTSLQHRITARYTFCQSTTAGSTCIPRYRRGTFARRAFAVSGPSVWNLLPDYLRDPAVGRDAFRKHLKAF